MRVTHDAAVGLLAEDLRKAHRRNNAAANDIRKDVTGADRGELIGIAHEQDAAVGLQRLEYGMHKRYVNHRALVDYKCIAGELILLALAEHDSFAVLGHFCAQHTVDRRCLHAAQLAHALGGAAGRSGKVCFEFKLVIQREHCLEYRRFARARAACYDEHAVLRGKGYRLALHRGILYIIRGFESRDN